LPNVDELSDAARVSNANPIANTVFFTTPHLLPEDWIRPCSDGPDGDQCRM
jgi:hypothetical protein